MSAIRVTARRLALASALLGGALGPPPARPAGPEDGTVTDLLKERLAVLREASALADADYRAGRAPLDRVQQAARALRDAELDLCRTDGERLAVLEKVVASAKASEKAAEARYKTGTATKGDLLMATAGRLEAEIAFERVKAKARPK
jgi:outer membrane protein TolC